jgi:hypothetical protein
MMAAHVCACASSHSSAVVMPNEKVNSVLVKEMIC